MEPIKTRLRKKCPSCGYWNKLEVLKHFVPEPSPEQKVSVFMPYYEPLKVETCKKCKTVIAEPKTLIRIVRGSH